MKRLHIKIDDALYQAVLIMSETKKLTISDYLRNLILRDVLPKKEVCI
jgi:Arc/MetJ family transcription regulator